MICDSFRAPDGAVIIACRSGRRGNPKCDVCEVGLGAHWLCDGPSRRSSGKGTCDRKLCGTCRRPQGEERDLCPEHNHHEQGALGL